MQRRTNIQVSSLINILGVLTILIQFFSYYFIETTYAIWGISCFISALSCYFIVEQTVSYEACYNFSFFTLFVSLVILALSYFGRIHTFMPFSNTMLGIAIINWLVPMLFCYIRHMLDSGNKIEDYHEFYRNSSIIFLIFYTAVMIYAMFVENTFLWAHPQTSQGYNFIPFNVISLQIEDYLYGYLPLSKILIYLLGKILIYAPYGFYLTHMLRRRKRLVQFLSLLILPLVIELLQFLLLPAYCDIDDLIYGLIGGLLGLLFFYLTCFIFHAFSGKEYLRKDGFHRYSNSSLHF